MSLILCILLFLYRSLAGIIFRILTFGLCDDTAI